jgi:hypothetical protein
MTEIMDELIFNALNTKQEPKKEFKSVLDIAKEYFPDASEDDLWFIIWEETGYPQFWNIPQDGDTPEACFRKHLQDFKNKTVITE